MMGSSSLFPSRRAGWSAKAISQTQVLQRESQLSPWPGIAPWSGYITEIALPICFLDSAGSRSSPASSPIISSIVVPQYIYTPSRSSCQAASLPYTVAYADCLQYAPSFRLPYIVRPAWSPPPTPTGLETLAREHQQENHRCLLLTTLRAKGYPLGSSSSYRVPRNVRGLRHNDPALLRTHHWNYS
jgi:hypothetical protein